MHHLAFGPLGCESIQHFQAGWPASGETDWLARRLGIVPSASESAPTPWVHSDVLALIARDGLRIRPHSSSAEMPELHTSSL